MALSSYQISSSSADFDPFGKWSHSQFGRWLHIDPHRSNLQVAESGTEVSGNTVKAAQLQESGNALKKWKVLISCMQRYMQIEF